jgi:hypothetical protein
MMQRMRRTTSRFQSGQFCSPSAGVGGGMRIDSPTGHSDRRWVAGRGRWAPCPSGRTSTPSRGYCSRAAGQQTQGRTMCLQRVSHRPSPRSSGIPGTWPSPAFRTPRPMVERPRPTRRQRGRESGNEGMARRRAEKRRRTFFYFDRRPTPD